MPSRTMLGRATIVLLMGLAGPLFAAELKDECEVTLSGAIDKNSKGPGAASSVGTDYWMTEDELRQALRIMAGIGGKKLSDEEKAKKVEEQMKEEPRLMLLLVNCETPDVTISLSSSRGSKYKDIPFKAGTYDIAPGAKSKPGQIEVLLNVKTDSNTFYGAQGGKLVISEWDKRHIAGSFEIATKPTLGTQGKPLSLKGRFDFKCRAGKGCQP